MPETTIITGGRLLSYVPHMVPSGDAHGAGETATVLRPPISLAAERRESSVGAAALALLAGQTEYHAGVAEELLKIYAARDDGAITPDAARYLLEHVHAASDALLELERHLTLRTMKGS